MRVYFTKLISESGYIKGPKLVAFNEEHIKHIMLHHRYPPLIITQSNKLKKLKKSKVIWDSWIYPADVQKN